MIRVDYMTTDEPDYGSSCNACSSPAYFIVTLSIVETQSQSIRLCEDCAQELVHQFDLAGVEA